MHRSRMMKALETLETRGVIRRRPQRYAARVKIYRINWDVDLTGLEASAPRLRASRPAPDRRDMVSGGDEPVSVAHSTVSTGEIAVSLQDPRERYEEKSNLDSNQENTRQPKLAASAARSPDEEEVRKIVRPAQARPGPRPEISPRSRRRPPI